MSPVAAAVFTCSAIHIRIDRNPVPLPANSLPLHLSSTTSPASSCPRIIGGFTSAEPGWPCKCAGPCHKPTALHFYKDLPGGDGGWFLPIQNFEVYLTPCNTAAFIIITPRYLRFHAIYRFNYSSLPRNFFPFTLAYFQRFRHLRLADQKSYPPAQSVRYPFQSVTIRASASLE